MRTFLRLLILSALESVPVLAPDGGTATAAARRAEAEKRVHAMRYPRCGSKLGRRLRRKAQLGMAGAF